jgi:hypothetical protein
MSSLNDRLAGFSCATPVYPDTSGLTSEQTLELIQQWSDLTAVCAQNSVQQQLAANVAQLIADGYTPAAAQNAVGSGATVQTAVSLPAVVLLSTDTVVPEVVIMPAAAAAPAQTEAPVVYTFNYVETVTDESGKITGQIPGSFTMSIGGPADQFATPAAYIAHVESVDPIITITGYVASGATTSTAVALPTNNSTTTPAAAGATAPALPTPAVVQNVPQTIALTTTPTATTPPAGAVVPAPQSVLVSINGKQRLSTDIADLQNVLASGGYVVRGDGSFAVTQMLTAPGWATPSYLVDGNPLNVVLGQGWLPGQQALVQGLGNQVVAPTLVTASTIGAAPRFSIAEELAAAGVLGGLFYLFSKRRPS